MKAFVDVMKALSDPNRVKIIMMLQQKVMCVCELREVLQVAQPTVSKHLKILENAGLVTSKKDGIWVNYELENGSTNLYSSTILDNMKNWFEQDEAFTEIKKNIVFISRDTICSR
ncbi:MAG: winged helix-turn-helix transcriptional regulator [Deltaproteobacteria bacterium]|nr:winged helix-turn-helix transcriptional regulator [Deltaproteobacteria bacterium]